MFRVLMISFLALALTACATSHLNQNLLRGKRYFETGYYKRAMHQLMPLAISGEPEAQYAVGYMYYYGYGVAQDTDMGYFWIKKSADRRFPPAVVAYNMIMRDEYKEEHAEQRYKVKSKRLEEKGIGPEI
jgi:TPR repeat protein